MVKEKTAEKFECEYCKKEYDYKSDAESCEENHKQEKEEQNIERAEKFTITENHLKLLKRMFVGWNDCEFGAPEIDPKRPYGNSSVEQDILEIIGFEEIDEERFKFILEGKEYILKGEDKYNIELEDEEELCKKLWKLNREMQIVLQICLSLGTFETGDYIKGETYDSLSWKKSGETNQKGVELK